VPRIGYWYDVSSPPVGCLCGPHKTPLVRRVVLQVLPCGDDDLGADGQRIQAGCIIMTRPQNCRAPIELASTLSDSEDLDIDVMARLPVPSGLVY
jgi:hypothetical protein